MGCDLKKHHPTCLLYTELKQIFPYLSYSVMTTYSVYASLQFSWWGPFTSQPAGRAWISMLIWCCLPPFYPFLLRLLLLSHTSSAGSQSVWWDQVSCVESGGFSSLCSQIRFIQRGEAVVVGGHWKQWEETKSVFSFSFIVQTCAQSPQNCLHLCAGWIPEWGGGRSDDRVWRQPAPAGPVPTEAHGDALAPGWGESLPTGHWPDPRRSVSDWVHCSWALQLQEMSCLIRD